MAVAVETDPEAADNFESQLAACKTVENFISLTVVQFLENQQGRFDYYERAKRVDAIYERVKEISPRMLERWKFFHNQILLDFASGNMQTYDPTIKEVES